MKRIAHGPLLLALACACAAGAAETTKERIVRLQNGVLAPCCYNEPIARHQSEVAVKMRLEVERLAYEGRTDDEILGQYVRQYGAKVLVDPRTRPTMWSLAAPWAVVVFGVIGLTALIWKWRKRTTALASARASSAPGPPLPDMDDED